MIKRKEKALMLPDYSNLESYYRTDSVMETDGPANYMGLSSGIVVDVSCMHYL